MDGAIAQTIQGVFLILLVVVALLVATGVTALGLYIFAIYTRLQNRQKQSLDMITLEIRVSQDNEIKIDAAEQMFLTLASLKRHSGWAAFLEVDEVVSFEMVGTNGEIRFLLSCPSKFQDIIEKQIYAFYPVCNIEVVEEPNIFSDDGHVAYAQMRLKDPQHNPFKTYKEQTTDSLSTILSPLSKMSEGEGAIIQILIRGAGGDWKKAGKDYLASTKKAEASPDKATFKVDQKVLEQINTKVTQQGFETLIRIVVSSKTKDAADLHLRNIKASFLQFNSDLTSFTSAKIWFQYGFMIGFLYKFFPLIKLPFWPATSIMTPDELATLFHLPNKTIETPYIKWLKAKTAPVASIVPQEGGTFVGNGYFRGIKRKINILLEDRRRHVYIIGKTGVGKSWLLKDMASQDIAAGHGVCIIDPHGDLVEDVLKRVPPERAEDVIYFDPSDVERPMGINLLQVDTEDEKHMMTQAIINLMYKLYDPGRTGIIGPRFEHAVRNAMLTVMVDEGSTFIEIQRCLTDQNYVKELLPKLKDPIVKRYWTDQIAQTDNFHKSETLDYIVSKFGRFITNILIRNIIGQSKSAFDFREAMDSKKIILINLSKGKLGGEENSQFLGLLLVPMILAAAMSRQDVPEDQRQDFFLYVDEFQNFATPDFATILSEARKYRLNLTVANQYIGQMPDDIRNAIIGNVGTIISFRIGTDDAPLIARELIIFSEQDLQNVEKYHAYMKTTVNNEPVPAFAVDMQKDPKSMKSLDNPKLAEAIIKLSRLKYGVHRSEVEKEIQRRSNL